MAIRITEDGVVIYENEPEVDRELFPNIKNDCDCQEQINEIKENLSELQKLVGTKAGVIYETASGAIASFADGADDMPLKSCVVSIEPTQEGSGDPIPENVRPISGRTGLTVSHSGDDTSDPTTISVDWETEAGTVYGGTLDVVSGKLVIDCVYTALPGISGTAVSGDVRRWFTGIFSNYLEIVACDSLKASDIYTPTDLDCAFLSSNRIIITPSWGQEITTVAEFNALLAEHPINMVIRTAEQTEIQLSPQEVRTLLGENNIWSDGGDMEVEYPADTKLYIENLTVPTEDGMIVDHAISANNFFMVGNTLYRATTAIASGATITVGTNAVKLSLSDALNALA